MSFLLIRKSARLRTELTKIRLSLQTRAAALQAHAVANPDAKAATELLRLSVECSELDAQIAAISTKIWKKRRPGDIAR